MSNTKTVLCHKLVASIVTSKAWIGPGWCLLLNFVLTICLFESTTWSNKEDWDQCIATIAAHKVHGQLECKTWVKIAQVKYHQCEKWTTGFMIFSRVRKTPSARQQCWPESFWNPESFCESRKFLRIRKVFATSSLFPGEFPDILENVRILYKISR